MESPPVTEQSEAGSTAVTDTTTTPRHYDFLDGLRAILALTVVVQHAWYTVSESRHGHFDNDFRALRLGHDAVCFFIILSGFCLTLPVLKNGLSLPSGPLDFMKRRAWRIIPPYYLAMLLSLILIHFLIGQPTGTHWDTSLPVGGLDIIRHLLLVQNFFNGDMFKINHVFWSIAVEWQIYFFFPLLLLLRRKTWPLLFAMVVVLISLVVEIVIRAHWHVFPYLYFLGLFAMGMLAAEIGFSSSRPLARYQNLPWKWSVVGSFVLFAIGFRCVPNQYAQDILFSVFAGSVLVACSRDRGYWLHRFLSFKPLVFVGSFSYSLYLVHAPLLQILWQYPLAFLQSRPHAMCAALLVIGTPVVLLAAYGFHLVCERPFLRKRS